MAFNYYPSRQVRAGAVGLVIGLIGVGIMPVSASSANISHAYQSKKTVPVGSLVSLDAKNTSYIVAANQTNAARIAGIAVNSDDSLLAVDATNGRVQVATSGIAPALVSDLNGSIHVGDQVAVSPFDGIGMKAAPDTYVIGLAQSALGATNGVQTRTVIDSRGISKQIHVGTVQVMIAPGAASGGGEQNLTSLQKIVHSLTGRVIPTGRIVVALLITSITLIALIVLVYGSVYSTIISIGRNPLAKYAVYRSLTTVLTVAFIVAAVAMGVALLLLR